MIITRTFDAPRSLMFRMWTEQEHVARWWGPYGFTNPICELDVRPGGAIRIIMRGPAWFPGIFPMKGIYHEILAPERLVWSSMLEDAEESKTILELSNATVFEEQSRKTILRVQTDVIASAPEAFGPLSGMKMGWMQSLERLARYVAVPDIGG